MKKIRKIRKKMGTFSFLKLRSRDFFSFLFLLLCIFCNSGADVIFYVVSRGYEIDILCHLLRKIIFVIRSRCLK